MAARKLVADLQLDFCLYGTAFNVHPAQKAKKSSLTFSPDSSHVEGN